MILSNAEGEKKQVAHKENKVSNYLFIKPFGFYTYFGALFYKKQQRNKLLEMLHFYLAIVHPSLIELNICFPVKLLPLSNKVNFLKT